MSGAKNNGKSAASAMSSLLRSGFEAMAQFLALGKPRPQKKPAYVYVKAKSPFNFQTRISIPELTGIKAYDLEQLLEGIKTVPDASIFYHTHHFIQKHLHISLELPNDFAYWISSGLGDNKLAESLASINIVKLQSIKDIRENIVSVIEGYLKKYPRAKHRTAFDDEPFHFLKSVSFIFPTKYTANDLPEFYACLKEITTDSLYFHIFEARLRVEKGDNDFSRWLADSLGDTALAEQITKLDPYTCSADGLRENILKLIEKRLGL